MKKTLFQFQLLISSALPLWTIISCSANQNQNQPEPDSSNTVLVLQKEVQRVTDWAQNLSFKTTTVTTDFIKSLNPNNLLSNLNNWEPAKDFLYQIEIITNALEQRPDANQQQFLQFTITVTYQNKSQTISDLKVGYQLEADAIPPTNDLFNPAGGSIDNGNLKVSQYQNLIASLNLFQKTTVLSKLTNEILQTALNQNQILKNLQLTINDQSNTLNGQLFLNLRGQINNQIVNALIEIKGFNQLNTNSQSVEYTNFELDQKAWFTTLKPIATSNDKATINQINSNDWKQLLTNFQVLDATNQRLIASMQQLSDFGFEFQISAKLSNDQKINFTIQAQYQHYQYQTNDWKPAGQPINWQQARIQNAKADLFTLNDVKAFIINESQIDESMLAEHYPSYYLGLQNFYKKTNTNTFGNAGVITNQWVENESFVQRYFPANTNLAANFLIDSVISNDWNNYLQFQAVLIVNGQPEQQFSKLFEVANKMKRIQDWEGLKKNNPVSINPDTSFFNNITKNFLKNQHQALVDQMFTTQAQMQEINGFSQALIPAIISRAFDFTSQDENQINQQWNQIKDQIQPALFGKPWELDFQQSNDFNGSDNLNFYSQLFWINSNNAFVVNSLQYQINAVNQQASLKLIPINQEQIQITLQGKTLVQFDQENREFPTTFSFLLNKEAWENIKKT